MRAAKQIEGRRRPLRSASIQSSSVLPVFTQRQLRALDRAAEDPASSSLPRSAGRSIRRERARTLREMRRRAAELDRSRRRTREASDRESRSEELPRTGALKALALRLLPSGGADRLRVPRHSSSALDAGVLIPFLSSGQTLLDGPLIGIEHYSGTPFRFDMWSPYRRGWASSVNMVIFGTMGSGKSMCLKVLATRECGWTTPRGVIVQSDPKGEWAAVARAVGGQVVSIGHGRCLNPLDVPDPVDGADLDQWKADAAAARGVAVRGLVISVREGRSPTPAENAMIAAACQAMGDGACEPTIRGLVGLLESGWAEDYQILGLPADRRRTTADSLILALDTLVNGTYRDAFDRESTVEIDPMSPMIVFDTSGIPEGDTIRRQVYAAAASAWIDRILSARDGRFRIVIAEEGHEVLANPELVASWDRRMRLSGDWACSCVMLLHELSDLTKFGEPGSAHRNLIDSVLTKASIQVIYRQTAASVDFMRRLMDLNAEELAAVPNLPVGTGLWRIGDGTNKIRALVDPRMSQQAYRIFDTSARRGG